MKEKTSDIDILEELVNGFDNLISYKQKQAIETLIAENKGLKEENKCLKNKELDYMTVYLNGVYDGEKKVKDKIKAKIEEVKDGTYDAKIVLQSLL